MRTRIAICFALVVPAATIGGCGQVIGLGDGYVLGADGGQADTATARDGGQIDTGFADVGATDAAAADSEPTDAGFAESGPNDAGANDAGSTDAGPNDAGSTDAGSADAGPADAGPDPASIPAPHLIAPLSSATVTKMAPTLKWQLSSGTDGAVVELCPDRRCATPQPFPFPGLSQGSIGALSPGVHFWRARGTFRGVTGSTPSPIWQFTVGHRSATVDTSWGTAPDFNGDGRAEIVVGTGDVNQHGVDILSIGPTRELTQRVTISNPGYASNEQFAIPSAADVDGDGYVDLLVGAPCFTSDPCDSAAGRTYVFKGGPGGITDNQPAAWVLQRPSDAGPSFGTTTGSAGDLNGDGYADIMIGDPSNDGRIYIFRGSAAGVESSPWLTLALGVPAFTGASACDVNDDGNVDVIVSAGAGSGVRFYPGQAAGAGPSSFPIPLASPQSGTSFGQAISIFPGDVDGDGICDIFAGVSDAPVQEDGGVAGEVYIYKGGANLSRVSAPQWVLTGAGGGFGSSLQIAGDLDADGFDDLVVGADSYDGGAGRAYFFAGSSSNVSNDSSVVLGGDGGNFGYQVAAAGDTDGDGIADALVGTNLGNYVNLYFGQAPSGGAPGGISDTNMLSLGPGPAGNSWWYEVIVMRDSVVEKVPGAARAGVPIPVESRAGSRPLNADEDFLAGALVAANTNDSMDRCLAPPHEGLSDVWIPPRSRATPNAWAWPRPR